MTEIEIGRGKRGRRAYAFDDIAVVPSRRTRDPKEVSIAWQIDAYRFELPFLAAPMDSVVSPETAIRIGNLGGLGVLNLEGLWTRYDDPEPLLDEIAELDDLSATAPAPGDLRGAHPEELIGQRIKEVRDAGVVTAAALSPQRTAQFSKAVVDAGRGPVRHPRHDGLRRARLRLARAAQPQAVHLRARRPGDRRRLRHATPRRCT